MRNRSAPVLLALFFIPATALGWWHFSFLTDDAFIAFRYASNAMQGYGLVWNPPPFQPVEGYTSWLWVQIMLTCWKVTGLEPPLVANYVSLLFGYATLAVVCALVLRMELPASFDPHRWTLLSLVLLGTVANRTFLAWLSSGLETALFNFGFTLWIFFAFEIDSRRGRWWPFWLAFAAAIAALTRPDGLLIVTATLGLFVVDLVQRPSSGGAVMNRLAMGVPLLAVPTHILWRRWTYGEWLPNTYFAKYVSPWPESGWRYVFSFVLEYAVWLWIAIALASLLRWRRPSWSALIAAATIVFHLTYYTLVIGGDHFEYRVYSYTVPLLFVSFLWFAGRLELPVKRAGLLLTVFVLASLPIPWIHHMEWDEAGRGPFQPTPIAQRLPSALRWYGNSFDSIQGWLLERSVGIRQEAHADFYDLLDRSIPPREEGAKIRWDDRPLIALGSVGVVAWRLPHVAVLDRLGLNDYLIARAGQRRIRGGKRHMAHERMEPEGYIDCFRPNVKFEAGVFVVEQRQPKLTDDEIIGCELKYRAQL